MDEILKKLFYEAETCQRNVLMLLADRYEELGQTELARAYRWMADNRKWPLYERAIRIPSTYERKLSDCTWMWMEFTEYDKYDSQRLPFEDLAYWNDELQIKKNSLAESLNDAARGIAAWLAKTDGNPCHLCDGTGMTWRGKDYSDDWEKITCPDCNGTGRNNRQ